MLVKETNELPEDLALLPFSESEFRRLSPVERKIFIRRSPNTWVVYDDEDEVLMCVGITQPSQLSTPEIWMLLCAGFSKRLRRNILEVRERLEELLALYPHVIVRVDAAIPAGQKFVRFMGFTEYYRDTKGEREYIYYEVRRGVRNSSGT